MTGPPRRWNRIGMRTTSVLPLNWSRHPLSCCLPLAPSEGNGGIAFMFRRLKSCHNVEDMRLLAKQRLPSPIFHYIDGAADDEVTYRRNTKAFEECDLVPNVLAGVDKVDMSVTVMGLKLDLPIFCAPTALQRLFHHDGEREVARAAEKFGTMFGVSSLATVSLEEIGGLVQPAKG